MSGWGERYSGLWAMLVGLALLAGGYWFWSALRRNPPLAVVAARPGRMQSFWLPDSSFFLLQGESQILYPVRGFGTRLRQIALQGQAYVEVRSGKIPLRIRCDSLYVDVSGPAVGNIRWRYGRLELTVVSGRFLLRAPDGHQWILEDWQRIVWPQPAHIETRSPFPYIQWRFGWLYFFQTPLYEVLDELRRSWDLRLEADSSLLYRPVSATFSPDQTYAEVLDQLAARLRFRVVPVEDGWRLEGEE